MSIFYNYIKNNFTILIIFHIIDEKDSQTHIKNKNS